jgi:hypothetical protein
MEDFDVASAAVNAWLTPGHKTASSYGKHAEHLAIAELLKRGHRVAVPVVDDDGVDIVVNYRTRVQVKSSNRSTLEPVSGYSYGRLAWSSKRVWTEADIFLLYGNSRWWVVPASVLSGCGRTFSIYTEGTRQKNSRMATVAEYEDAWDVFDAA